MKNRAISLNTGTLPPVHIPPLIEASLQDQLAALPGIGGAQGTLVGLGNGILSQSLYRDASAARELSRAADQYADGDELFFDCEVWSGAADRDAEGDALFFDCIVWSGVARRQTDTAAQKQQCSIWGALSIAGVAALKAAGFAADVMKFANNTLDDGMNRLGTAIVDGAKAAQGQLAALISPPADPVIEKTAREENLDRIRELIVTLDAAHQVLNHQVASKTGSEVISSAGRLTPVQQSYWDAWSHLRSTMSGAASAGVSALPSLSVAAAAPVIAGGISSAVRGPVGSLAVMATAYTGAAFLALTTLRGLPQQANDNAVAGLIDAKMTEADGLMAELKGRIEEEKTRCSVESRMVLVAGTRPQQINALAARLKHVEKALQLPASEPATGVAMSPLQHRVRVSDGEQRKQTLAITASVRERLVQFFTRIIDFFFARRNAFKQEQIYVASVQPMLKALAACAPDSRVNTLEDVAVRRRAAAGAVKMNPAELRKQLMRGENLTRTLHAAKTPSFGVVPFGNIQDLRAVAATLTTSRMIALYLDTLADLPQEEKVDYPHAPQVTRNDDGSLGVSDPDRKLYSFLMSVPTAYARMMKEGHADLSEVMTIDDHSPGMPGGMYGMQFKAGLDQASHASVLNLSFTPQSSGQVFKPLGNELETLYKLRDAMRDASASAALSEQEIATMSPQELRALQSRLMNALTPLLALHRADAAQGRVLENWRNPDLEAQRARALI